MKVVPLAADSLGVRSMATYVEVGRTSILIDPGAALAPSRFNLPPADAEWEALRRANDRIAGYGARADIVFVSHYHEDHFRHDPAAYQGHRVLAKDPRRMVTGLQADRAAALWRSVGTGARFEVADGRTYEDLDLSLRVSPPLPHGAEGTPLGAVVALTVTDRSDGFRFVFASDVQGPLSPVATAYIARERPHLLYLSGPPGYIEKQVGTDAIDRGIDNLLRIVRETGCRVILDHHSARETRATTRLGRLWDTGKVVTAAGYLEVPEQMLEARRSALWAGQRRPPARIVPSPSIERRRRRARDAS
jgi:predicted metallo-beta-lactamase superfamily hydrolase